jgi:WD40 repeat protein
MKQNQRAAAGSIPQWLHRVSRIFVSCFPCYGVLLLTLIPLGTASAQDATEKFLIELQKIQADYCELLFYPATLNKPQPLLRWDTNDAKQAKIARLSKRGVDPELLTMVENAKSLSDEISKLNRDYQQAIEEAGKEYDENPPQLDGSPGDLFATIKPLLPGVQLESQLSQLRTRCKTDEAEFSRRWQARLIALAAAQPRLKPLTGDPDATSPLSGFGMPSVAWTTQELGTRLDNPYDLGELQEPIMFDVAPLPQESWVYYYRFELPAPALSANNRGSEPQFQTLSVQVTSTTGLVHARLMSNKDGKVSTANERATARPGQPGQLQMPMMLGETYFLSVYHVSKPEFGPAWGTASATLRLWKGEQTKPPTQLAKREITIESQKQMRAEQQAARLAAHQRLQRITLATFSQKPQFEGTYFEQGKHKFTLKVQGFTAASRGITGEIDWPTYGGATRFRGQLVPTSNGLEVNFTETDFVPGRSSPKLLLQGEYRLIPELQKDQLVLRGEVSYGQRKHPIILNTSAIDSDDTGGAVVPNVTELPRAASDSKAPRDPRAMAAATPSSTPPSTPPSTKTSEPTRPGPNGSESQPDDVVSAAEFTGLTVTRPSPGITHRAGPIHVFQDVTSYDGPQSILFSKDGKSAYATGDHLRGWDLGSARLTFDVDQQSFQSVLLPNGSKMLFTGGVGSASHALFQLQARKGAPPPAYYEELERTTALAVSRDGKTAVISKNPGVLVFYDLIKNRHAQIPLNLGRDANALAFAESSNTLISADESNGIRIWKLKDDGELLGRFDGHGQRAFIRSMHVSEDGQQVLSVSSKSGEKSQAGPLTLIIWDRAQIKEQHSVSLGAQAISVAISPDWKYALVGEMSGEVMLCSIATGEILETFNGHTGPVTAVAFSPCWKFGLSASSDATVRLWGLANTP